MNLTDKTIWAEFKFKFLESALMFNEGYSNEDVIAKLMEIVEIIENIQSKG